MTDTNDSAVNAAGKDLAPWQEEADRICAEMVSRAPETIRKVTDSVYENMLYDVQEYLRENVHYNLSGELDRAKRETLESRQKMSAVAECLKNVRAYVDHVAMGRLIACNGKGYMQQAKDDIKVIDAAIEATRR